jgi:outer membrane protein assembly factor BamB
MQSRMGAALLLLANRSMRSILVLALLAFAGASSVQAATTGSVVPVDTGDCPEARFGEPALLTLGGNIFVSVVGERCGHVAVVDGRTGAVRRRIESPASNVLRRPADPPFGTAIGLWRRSILVGAPDERAVYALDPRTGSVVQRYASPGTEFGEFGNAVAGVGRHVVVGAEYTGNFGPDLPEYGAVAVFDGASGRFERSVESPTGSGARSFGRRLATVDRDHVAVGTDATFAGTRGPVLVVDVTTGKIVFTLAPPVPDTFPYGGGFTATRDRIVVGAPGGPGAVYVYHARDGHLVRTIGNPGSNGEAFGAAVAVRGPLLLVLAPLASTTQSLGGGAYLFVLRSGRLLGRIDLVTDARAGSVDTGVFLRRGLAIGSRVFSPSVLTIDYRDRRPK